MSKKNSKKKSKDSGANLGFGPNDNYFLKLLSNYVRENNAYSVVERVV